MCKQMAGSMRSHSLALGSVSIEHPIHNGLACWRDTACAKSSTQAVDLFAVQVFDVFVGIFVRHQTRDCVQFAKQLHLFMPGKMVFFDCKDLISRERPHETMVSRCTGF